MGNSTFLKFLFGFSVFFAILPTYGQITILSSDFEPFLKAGGKYTNYHDATTKTVNIGTAGQTSWDFSGLVSTSDYVVYSEPVKTSSYASDFPDAQYASYYESIEDGNLNKTWIYSSIIGEEYVSNGSVLAGNTAMGKIVMKIKFSPVWVHYKFPVKMGDSYKYNGTQLFNSVMSIPNLGDIPSTSTQTVVETQTVDAYGVVTLPNGKKMDALRIKRVQTTTDDKDSKTVLDYTIITKAGHSVSITPVDLNATAGNVSVSDIKWDILSEDSTPVETVSAPSELNATPDKTQVVLSWKDNSTNETGFVVERAEGNSTNFTSVGSTTANVVTYSDNTAIAGIVYTYRIKAIGTNISSDFSNTSSATIPLVISVISPSGLTAKVENNSIILNWKDNANNETGFVVERTDINSSNYVILASLGANIQTYTDVSATPNMLYSYRLKAVSDNISSDFSNTVSITIQVIEVVKAPSGLTAKVENNTIVLNWKDNSGNETGFVVERAEGNSTNYTTIGSILANVETYSDKSVIAGITYTYRIKATGASSNSEYSDSATTTFVTSSIEIPEGNPILLTNYPNPMRSATVISFYLPRKEKVAIVVYDLSGKTMERLVEEQMEQGKHEVILERKGLKRGIYLYSISTSNYKQTGKLIVE